MRIEKFKLIQNTMQGRHGKQRGDGLTFPEEGRRNKYTGLYDPTASPRDRIETNKEKEVKETWRGEKKGWVLPETHISGKIHGRKCGEKNSWEKGSREPSRDVHRAMKAVGALGLISPHRDLRRTVLVERIKQAKPRGKNLWSG